MMRGHPGYTMKTRKKRSPAKALLEGAVQRWQPCTFHLTMKGMNLQMTFDEICSRFQHVEGKGDVRQATCPCPGHANGDKKPSVRLTYDSHRRMTLMYCHTDPENHNAKAICAAIGITLADLHDEPMKEKSEAEKVADFMRWWAERNGEKFEAAYSYNYGQFQDGLYKIRLRDKDNEKDFRWIIRDPSRKSGFRMTAAHKGSPSRLYVVGSLSAGSVFVVEGEKDADNLHRLMGITTVCSENGATKSKDPGKKWSPEYNAQLAGKTVFILFDNDTSGRSFAALEAAQLLPHAEKVYLLDLFKVWPDAPEKSDISDMIALMGDEMTRKHLEILMQGATEYTAAAPDQAEPTNPTPQSEAAQSAEEQPQTATTPAHVHKDGVQCFDDFIERVTSRAFEPFETGMQAFDRLLGGGIPPQSLVLLSAAPGAGKTALCQCLFEGMAARGRDCVFLNLEMSREQLLARSLSRLIYHEGHDMTAADILRGYKWSAEQQAWVISASRDYRQRIAPRMQYNPDDCGTDLDAISAALVRAAEAAQAAGKPAPCAVLDYLHLVTAEGRMDASEIIKKTVYMLKAWAIRYNTFVFAIVANNRTANRGGPLSLDSGRDSGAIEYSGDIFLTLNYREIHEGKKDPGKPDDMEQLQKEKPRRMILQVLKHRMGEVGQKLYMNFDAAHSDFLPLDRSGMVQVSERTPFDENAARRAML